MKIVKNTKTKELKKVTDAEADVLVRTLSNYAYAPKSEWKALTKKAS